MPRYALHYQLIDPAQQGPRSTFVLDPTNPIAVRGPQKAANRWLKVFLTPKGTDPLRRDEGTGFAFLPGSNVANPADVQQQLVAYVSDATEQVQAMDARNAMLDDDERVRNANLSAFNVLGPASIEFFVELVTLSGDRVLQLIPLALG